MYSIIVFNDGSMMVIPTKNYKQQDFADHEAFSCDAETTIEDISEWLASDKTVDRKIRYFNSTKHRVVR